MPSQLHAIHGFPKHFDNLRQWQIQAGQGLGELPYELVRLD
jgi:hypothetical protein